MTYVLSSIVIPSRVFLTKQSACGLRWDPHYHQPRFRNLEKRLDALDAVPICSCSDAIFSGITPLSGGDAYTEAEDGIAFIRSGDFNEDGSINEGAVIRLKPEVHRKLMRRSQLSSQDVLFAIVGATIGKVGIFPGGYEANVNQAICAVRFSVGVLPQFAHAFFLTVLGQAQIERIKRPVARANINLEEVGSLRIPLLSDAQQKRVVRLLREAVDRKKHLESKAQRCLANIDDVLLDELGIKLKPEPPSAIESRIFLRAFSQLTGNRLDTPANWRQISLATDKFPMRKLREIIAVNPRTALPKVDPETPVSFVPMDAVSDLFGEIRDRQTRPLSECKSYTTFQEGDLIWAKITPCMENGKSALASKLTEGFGFGSTEFHVIRPISSDINCGYLYVLLRLRTLRDHARLFFTGSSGHQRVDEQFFRHLEIPLPPPKIQERIAQSASAMKEEARRLFKEAADEMEKAKHKVEALILREGAAA